MNYKPALYLSLIHVLSLIVPILLAQLGDEENCNQGAQKHNFYTFLNNRKIKKSIF